MVANAHRFLIAIMVFTSLTLASASTISENNFPFAYLRQSLGAIFMLLIPGLCLLRILFPEKKFQPIHEIALSMCMSITLTMIIGLFLNYTPLGLSFFSIMLGNFAATFVLAILAYVRLLFQHSPT